MPRIPRSNTALALLLQGFRHDPGCFVKKGMDCGRCMFPRLLRQIEDEIAAPFIEFIVSVEQATKPTSVFMSGDTGGHRLSEPRAKELWLAANKILNDVTDESGEGLCMCGVVFLTHTTDPDSIAFCHFGWHTEACKQGEEHDWNDPRS